METTTLIIAVFGAVTGAASLGWAVASHVLSGGRVRVELRGGWVGPSNLITAPLTHDPVRPDLNFVDTPLLAVQVNNTGRLPVAVQGWTIQVGKVGIGHVTHSANQELPKLLGVGESATWIVPLESVLAAAEASRRANIDYQALRATVSLGSGKSRSSRVSPVRTSDLPAFFAAP